MKTCRVDSQALAGALRVIKRAVSKRTTLPVLEGILLRLGDDELILSATDLDIGITQTIPAIASDVGFELVLPSTYFTGIVDHIPEGDIEFKVDEASRKTTLLWESSEFSISGHDGEQFPDLTDVSDLVAVHLPADALRTLISETRFATSNDDTRPILTGAQLTLSDQAMTMIATDGYRVAYSDRPLDHTAGDDTLSSVIPSQALKLLKRILKGSEEVAVYATDDRLIFEVGSTVMESRSIEGEYPDILGLIPTQFHDCIECETQALKSALERMAVMAKADGFNNHAVTLEFQKEALKLTSQSADVGRSYEELSIECSAVATEQIGFNVQYLIDCLKNIKSDRVSMHLTGADKPAQLKPVDESHESNDQWYVVLPLRQAGANHQAA